MKVSRSANYSYAYDAVICTSREWMSDNVLNVSVDNGCRHLLVGWWSHLADVGVFLC